MGANPTSSAIFDVQCQSVNPEIGVDPTWTGKYAGACPATLTVNIRSFLVLGSGRQGGRARLLTVKAWFDPREPSNRNEPIL